MVCLYNHVYDKNQGNGLGNLPYDVNNGNLVTSMGGDDEWFLVAGTT